MTNVGSVIRRLDIHPATHPAGADTTHDASRFPLQSLGRVVLDDVGVPINHRATHSTIVFDRSESGSIAAATEAFGDIVTAA